MKVKAKLKGDVVKVKVLAEHVNAGPEEAEKKKIEPNFIKSLTAKCNNKVVFEVSGSGFVSKNPQFAFTFKGGAKGDEVEVTWTDLKGNTKSKKKAIK